MRTRDKVFLICFILYGLTMAEDINADVTMITGHDLNGQDKVVSMRATVGKWVYLSASNLPDACVGGIVERERAYFGLGVCAGDDPERIGTENHYDIVVGVVVNDRLSLEWNHKSNCRTAPLPCPWRGADELPNDGYDIVGLRFKF